MFLVVLIKDDKIDVVPRLLMNDAAAFAVINAFKNLKSDYLIFRGATTDLENLKSALESSPTCKGRDAAQLKTIIINLSKGYNVTLDMGGTRSVDAASVIANLEFDGYSKVEAQKLVSHLLINKGELRNGKYKFGYDGTTFYDNSVVAEVKEFNPTKPPSLTRFPKYMLNSERNLKAWQCVIKSYKTIIKQRESLADQWIAACILYSRLCNKFRIQPWVSDLKSPISYVNNHVEKIKKEDEKVEVFVNQVFDECEITNVKHQFLKEVVRVPVGYAINLLRQFILPSDLNSKLFFDSLRKNHGAILSKGKASFKLSSFVYLTFMEVEDKMYAETKFVIPHGYAKEMIDKYHTNENVQVCLQKMFNNWMTTGYFKLFKKDL